MLRRRRQDDDDGAVSARVTLARLEAVVDRLEGVYEQMAASVEKAKTLPPPKSEEH